jgi:hypothetical protein
MKTTRIAVPLFSQLDNAGGQGGRECMSSSCAMVAAFHGRVRTDDEYNEVRVRFGDTTNPLSHVGALEHLGLVAKFSRQAGRPQIEGEVMAGRPVAVGWLHQGPSSGPVGFGHWSVVAGCSDLAVWLLDPMGEPDLVRGGFVSRRAGWQGWASWRNWGPRWDVRPLPGGPPSARGRGWSLFVRPAR